MRLFRIAGGFPLKDEATRPHLSLPEQAYQALRRMILNLELLPGEKLVLRDLAERLQMSRTPVREALVRLSTEGLVETIPNKGMRVSVPTTVATREIYEIIAGLEGQAAKLAAERADAAMIDLLDRAVADQEAALAADDIAGWAEGDRVFHGLLLVAADNQRMRELMGYFEGHMQRIRIATIYQRRKPVQSVRDHRALVEAIRARDGERARQIHLAHRDQAFAEHKLIVADMLAFVYHVSPRVSPARAAAQENSETLPA